LGNLGSGQLRHVFIVVEGELFQLVFDF
jgi:hypothetical protein